MRVPIKVLLLTVCVGVVLYIKRDAVHEKWEQWSGLADLRAEMEDVKAARRAVEERAAILQKEREAAEADRDRLQDALKKLEIEFSDYKAKYKASVRSQIPGLQIGEVTVDGKQYSNTTVASLTDELVSLSHPFGIIRLERASVPKELAAMLAMEQSTPVHERIVPLLKEVDAHKAAIAPHQDGKTSEGQRR